MEQLSIFGINKLEKPLADRLRPKNISEFIGQEHLLKENQLLRQMIDSDKMVSSIFWGPPGVGKTSLANVIANTTKAKFIKLSAIDTSVKTIRDLVQVAREDLFLNKKTIVFLDEIHRFNKSQQDVFLPYVEDGSIILIGATTENPSFEINKALLSRCKVFLLKSLEEKEIIDFLKNTLKNTLAFPDKEIEIEEACIEKIASYSMGDLRIALNTLEILVDNSKVEGMKVSIKEENIKELLGARHFFYDKNSEEHYNLISALHKSMRSSDPDASVYWLSRMIEAGEDCLYIARRIIQFASEDIGFSDNNALSIALNTYDACRYLGYPDCDLALTQAVIYMSLAPKSDSVYMARLKAKDDVINNFNQAVPFHLRNASNKFLKDLGYAKNYEHAQAYEEKITAMQCLPNNLKGRIYYTPSENGKEKYMKERLLYIKEVKERLRKNPSKR